MRSIPREWVAAKYYDPRIVLVNLRNLAIQISGTDTDPKVARLRTRELRPFHQNRQALIFCYAMGEAVLGTPVAVAHFESEDFDCIARWQAGDELIYTAIQLKELAPEDLNPKASLEKELVKLQKYAASPELVVAFHINRRLTVNFQEIAVPKLPIAELWFYGALSPSQDDWLIHGNALRAPKTLRFRYPS